MSRLYALLIGIDDYDDRVVNDIRFHKLRGAVRDINHVHAFLRDHLAVPDGHILKLTAPRQGAGAPEGDWPTYTNLVAAFRQLLAMARQPGDQVYIHYSGHGGRAATAFPKLKGDNGFDEALVPVDIGDPSAQYLRDVEINTLLKQMADKGLEVTVVFDSCHSGGATRGLGQAVKRGISMPDTVVRPHVSAVEDVAAMVALWQGEAATTRGVKPASGWMLESSAYTFLAACRASESAYEYPFNGAEPNGALTYYLLDTLRQAGPNASYRTVMDRVVGNVRGLFAQQTPMLQGDGDRRIFGSEQIAGVHAVRVLEVTPDGKVRLQAGEVHGIAPGAQFNLFAFDADLADPEQRIAVAEIKAVDSSECSGIITELLDPSAASAGNLAVLIGAANVNLQQPVRVAIDDPEARGTMEEAITRHGKGFVVVAPADATPIFQVMLTQDGRGYVICDPAGVPLPHVPVADADDTEAVTKTVARLVHLAKYRSVASLCAPDGKAAGKMKAVLVNTPPPTDGRVVYRPGDTVTVRITNTQAPGAMDDTTRTLNVTALDLAEDWSITQIFPMDDADFESIDPGLYTDIEFEAYLPDGVDAYSDRIKVFATRMATDFRWLQLPVLDEPVEPVVGTKRSAGDPLAELHEQIVEDRATTRSIRLASKPKRTWTVDEVEIHVAR